MQIAASSWVEPAQPIVAVGVRVETQRLRPERRFAVRRRFRGGLPVAAVNEPHGQQPGILRQQRVDLRPPARIASRAGQRQGGSAIAGLLSVVSLVARAGLDGMYSNSLTGFEVSFKPPHEGPPVSQVGSLGRRGQSRVPDFVLVLGESLPDPFDRFLAYALSFHLSCLVSSRPASADLAPGVPSIRRSCRRQDYYTVLKASQALR